MVNIKNILASSTFAGFKNYSTVTGTGTLPSTSIPAGSFIQTTITLPLGNTNAVSTTQVSFPTIELFTRQLFGSVTSAVIASSYYLQAQSFYSGGSLNVLIVEVNNTGSAFTPPVQTINVNAKLYKAPF